jgi:hypothetical protein
VQPLAAINLGIAVKSRSWFIALPVLALACVAQGADAPKAAAKSPATYAQVAALQEQLLAMHAQMDAMQEQLRTMSARMQDMQKMRGMMMGGQPESGGSQHGAPQPAPEAKPGTPADGDHAAHH